MRGRWALIFAVWLTLFDVVFTLQYWSLESNPIVVSLGPLFFVVLKLGLLLALIGVWILIRRLEVPDAIIMADFVIWIYAVIMAFVAILNIIQILGFRF